jgi:hypothetical protein
MVIEALKAARDFIESDRQDLAESLTVNGEIVFEDDIDRGAMAEYVKVLVVIDAALEQALAAPTVQEPVKFLVNGTRFKMSFFGFDQPDDDDHGETDVGTYVSCFDNFSKELDGRWVALVAAEDDCHLKLTTPPAAPVQPVAWRLWDDEPGQDPRWQYYDKSDFKDGVNPMGVFTQLVALYTTPPAAQPAVQEPVGSMGMPLSCGKPLCAPGDHHPLCKLATPAAAPVQTVAEAWMHEDGRLTDAKAKTARVENFQGWRPLAFIASATPPAPEKGQP